MFLTDNKVEMVSIRKFVEDVLVALGLVTVLAYSVKPIMLSLFLINLQKKNNVVKCAVASWLVRSTLERAVRVRTLAGDSVLCSWARHFNLLSQCLSPPRCINGYLLFLGKSNKIAGE